MKLRRSLAFALVVALLQPFFVLAPMREVRASGIVCGNPGNDGAGGTLSAGVYNTYWAGTGILPAGSTSVTLGSPDTSAGGAATLPIVGDELLIIQMQDGTFNQSNSSAYGSGGATGSGLTSVGTAGLYEYVAVTAISGSTYSIESTGAGNGLLNTYTEAAATSSTTIKTYQIVRVPEYTTAKLSSAFTAAYWDGSTGGIAALDVQTGLNLGAATISAVGDGFRGGAFTYTGASNPTTVLNNDYEDSSQMNGVGNVPGQGSKGEGILGTPAYLFEYTDFAAAAAPAGPSTPAPAAVDGYPGGDMAMGAPGNAGGGGTDADPIDNDENTGGGGGANGGSGGKGGYPWTPNYDGNNSEYSILGVHAATDYSTANTNDIGGRGGTSLSTSVSAAQVFMGGGGGAGVNNNNSDNNTYNGYGSSGGVGGGMVLLRINGTGDSSTATINASGTTGLAPLNDGGGGGGAGGTIVITAPTTIGGTITAHALGAAGTTANATNDGGYSQQHGPGGGGGGGVVLSSSSVTATVTGGAAGTTTTMATTYGATAGATGYKNQAITAADIPGISSGAECTSTGNAVYTGPVDTGAGTHYGAEETGSFDGATVVNNNNDFTARDLYLGAGITTTNTGTSVTSPTGASLTLGAAPTVSIPNMLYDDNMGARETVTLTATAPTGWTVELCPDSGGGADHSTATTATGALCTYPTESITCTNGNKGLWMTKPAAAATATIQFCLNTGTVLNTAYWAVYTAPTTGLIPYSRYDASIELDDPTGAFNYTHNEIYADYVPLFKSASVVSTGCPSGVTPTLPTSDPTGAKVCHGGIIQYTVDYRNVILGAGQGTEGANAGAFDETTAGSLVITDNGTLSTVSQTTVSNWGTFTSGLKEALSAGLTNNTTCGSISNTCGDTTTGTTFTGNTINSKDFTATIGGAAFRLYPMNFAGQTGQGTITFAVTVL